MSEHKGDWMRGISPPRGRPASVSESRMSVMDRIAEISRLLEVKTGGTSGNKVQKGDAMRSFFRDSARHVKQLDDPPIPQQPPVATLPSVSPPADGVVSPPHLDSREISISPYQHIQQHQQQVPVQYVQQQQQQHQHHHHHHHLGNPLGYSNPAFPIIQNYPTPSEYIQPIPVPAPAPVPAPVPRNDVMGSRAMVSLHNPYGAQGAVHPPAGQPPAQVPAARPSTVREAIESEATAQTTDSQQVVGHAAPSSPSKSEIQTSPPKSDVESPKNSKKSTTKTARVLPTVTNLSEDLQEKLKRLDAADDPPPDPPQSAISEVCQNCDSRTTEVFCAQCDGFLCNLCSEQIHGNKLFKSHVVTEVAQQQSQPQLDSVELNKLFVPPVEVESEGESSSFQNTPKLLSATAEKLLEFENTKSPEVAASESPVIETASPQVEPEKPLDEVLESMFITINDMRQRTESPQPVSEVRVRDAVGSDDAGSPPRPPPVDPKPIPAPAAEPQQPPNFPSDITQVFHQLASIVEQFAQSPAVKTPHEKRPPTPHRTMRSLRRELEATGSPFGPISQVRPSSSSTPRVRMSSDILGNSPLIPTTLYAKEQRTVSPDRPYEGMNINGSYPLAL